MSIAQLHIGDIRTTGKTMWVVNEPQTITHREQLVKVTVAPMSERGITGATGYIEYKDLKI